MKKVLVIEDYQTPFPEGIILKQDDLVCVEKRKSEWEGWIWCTAPDGKQSWVPESFLDIKKDVARILLEYNASELSVTKGEELEILKEESGWLWCRNQKGKSGWVPKKCMKVG